MESLTKYFTDKSKFKCDIDFTIGSYITGKVDNVVEVVDELNEKFFG